MIEEDIQKLTAAITQLTTTAEALLETLRSRTTAISVIDELRTKPDALMGKLAEAIEEPAPKPKKAKAPKIEEPKPEPAPAPAAEPAPAPEAPAATSGVSLANIRAAAQKALDNGKVQQIVAINKQYGLKRVSDASPDQYAEILAKLEEINGQA